MSIKVEFLIIDPQNDFCHPNGSLFVPGAKEDSDRLAETLKRLRGKINDIHVTLDTHHYVDIAHPISWVDSSGTHPNPFTLISKEDVEKGVWKATNPQWQKRFLEYVTSLETNKRYLLCIWPPHCLIGSWGHNVIEPVYEELLIWEGKPQIPDPHFGSAHSMVYGDDGKKYFAMVDYVTKGSNFWTEHYSAVQADVPDSTDTSTLLNTPLIQTLQDADLIPLSGQALSHCVANTVRDIANKFSDDNVKKLVLLTDTTSSVPGFENLGQEFLDEMIGRGMQTSKAADFLA